MSYLLNVWLFFVAFGAVLHSVLLLIGLGQEHANLASFKRLIRSSVESPDAFPRFKRKVITDVTRPPDVPEVEEITLVDTLHGVKRVESSGKTRRISKHDVLKVFKGNKDLDTTARDGSSDKVVKIPVKATTPQGNVSMFNNRSITESQLAEDFPLLIGMVFGVILLFVAVLLFRSLKRRFCNRNDLDDEDEELELQQVLQI